jgi:DNA polymerase-1
MLYKIILIKKQKEFIHLFLAATNTGRLASSDPNLQNIPIKTLDGKKLEKLLLLKKIIFYFCRL